MTRHFVVTLFVICHIALDLPRFVDSESFYQWKNCEEQSGPISKGIRVKEFKMSPDPINIPGNIEVEFESEVIGDVIEPLTLDVDVWMLVDLYWFTARAPIPGCCSFKNICDMLGDDPDNFKCPVGMAENCIECTCPPSPGRYSTIVTPVVVNLDDLPFYVKLLVKIFVSGKYETRVTMTDGNDDVVLCMDISMEIATEEEEGVIPKRPVLDALPDYCYEDATTNSTSIIN